jgi:hypothetical protein
LDQTFLIFLLQSVNTSVTVVTSHQAIQPDREPKMNLTELTLNNSADLAVVYAKAGLSNAHYHAKEAASAAFRLRPDLREPMHVDDSECTVDPDTLLCVHCGVEHGEPCSFCGGRGFHRDHCETLLWGQSESSSTWSDEDDVEPSIRTGRELHLDLAGR